MNLQKICADTIPLVIEVGKYIIAQRKTFDNKVVEEKGLNQLVSFVDIEAEKQLVEGLKHIVPEAGFITEEDTVAQQQTDLVWIIDPLDGTTNFIHNLPVYSISVALARGNEILVGIVFELGKKDLFSAWQYGGAYCNGERIGVTKTTELTSSLIATGFPYYEFDQMDAYINTLTYLMKNTHGLRRLGSAAVDLAYVACGKFDGFFETGLHAWDVAAGCLLVQEAGGNVLDFKGGNDYLFGKSITAGNVPINKTLNELVKRNFG
ncbi:MAG: inositol monophosphatase family protein [Bacteroidota bacterium]|nr:inositol monophosphatase family protein [Bacteroidota bacterium]